MAVFALSIIVARFDCVTELEANDVVTVESIALESGDDQSCLLDSFKVSKSKMNFQSIPGNSGDQS